MPAARIFKHKQTDECNKATERRLWRRDLEMSARCGEMEFSIDGGKGDNMVYVVATFRYLGRTLDQTDDDWTAIQRNIIRVRLVWGRLGILL